MIKEGSAGVPIFRNVSIYWYMPIIWDVLIFGNFLMTNVLIFGNFLMTTFLFLGTSQYLGHFPHCPIYFKSFGNFNYRGESPNAAPNKDWWHWGSKLPLLTTSQPSSMSSVRIFCASLCRLGTCVRSRLAARIRWIPDPWTMDACM
jgi:hypothetical protein